MKNKSKTLVKRVTVALNFPGKIAEFILFAKAVFKAMTGNAYFTASAGKVTVLNVDITALDAAQTGCITTPPTVSVEARNVALEVVKNDLRALRNDVQTIADANPTKAEAIIISASMATKKAITHNKQKDSVKNSVEEGCVDLIAEGKGPHEWRMSVDNSTWTPLPSSMISKTTVSDLTPGSVYYFQNRQMLRNDVKTEWSQSIKIRVK